MLHNVCTNSQSPRLDEWARLQSWARIIPAAQRPFFWYRINLILAWTSNYIYHKDENSYPFPDFNFIELWDWISNIIPHFTGHVITYLYMLVLKLFRRIKRGSRLQSISWLFMHDDFIKWKHFPRYRPFVRGIHRPPVNSPHKGQWRGALMFSLIYTWINGWVNNGEAGDLRRHRAHYDVTVMLGSLLFQIMSSYSGDYVFLPFVRKYFR